MILNILSQKEITTQVKSKSPTNTNQAVVSLISKTRIEGSNIVIPKATLTITQTPTTIPTLTPTIIHDPTPRVEAPTQAQTPTTISTTSLSQQLLDQVNAFRASKGLSPVHSDGYTCAFAATRANEITGNFSHDGFNNRAAFHTLPYPSYSSVTENIALNSDPMQVVNAWIASPGHNENMQKDTPNVCIVNSGNYYAYEGWRP